MTETEARTSWEVGYRMRVTLLTEENRRLTDEMTGLQQRFEELQRRAGRVWQICDSLYGDTLARRLLRVLDGDPHEFQGRCGGGSATADAGRSGVDPDPAVGGGPVAVGGEAAAGSVCGETHPGGGGGVSGSVEAVATWPYHRAGGAEHDLVGGVTP